MADGSEEAAFVPPFRKIYFSNEMVSKYEPLATAMRKVTESEGRDDEVWEQYQEHLSKFNSFDWCSTWDGNRYDVVFYGASGYAGYLMTEYLRRVSLKRNPEPFTFALAGRSRSRVQDLRDRAFAGTKHEDAPILQMCYDDVFSIIDLVKSARVIVNVAGPYMLTQGELLIDACICMGVHYVDVSAEVPWTLRIKDLHRYALKERVFVVPSAGTAGGYPDLGVHLCAKRAREEHGEELACAACYVSLGGAAAAASCGTLRTRAALAGIGEAERDRMADPFSLGGFVPERDRWGLKTCSIELGTGKVSARMRPEDADANMGRIAEDGRLGIWRGPFQYSYFDARVVRRSNMLLADLGNRPYGRRLNFLEYAMLPSEALAAQRQQQQQQQQRAVSAGPRAPAAPVGGHREGGEGPALEELADAWTGYFLWAESEGGREFRCSFVGRDSYFETARLAVETAMCLRFDRERLPFAGGVLTPAVACADRLIERVTGTGVKLRTDDWFPASERSPPPC